jgi:SAM-dependent methyltransferase
MGVVVRVKTWAKPKVQKGSVPLMRALAPELMQYGLYWPHERGVRSYSRPAWEPAAKGADGFPIPPRELWAYYCTSDDSYLASGREDCEAMAKIIADSGSTLADAGAILDLGCAGGRMIRHIAAMAPEASIWGADVWSSAILWWQDHLCPPCSFAVTTISPHLPFEDRSFGLVYCGSLFTHIDDLAESWFAELHRILRPGGRLYFSVNDQHAVRIFEGEGDPAAYARYLRAGRRQGELGFLRGKIVARPRLPAVPSGGGLHVHDGPVYPQSFSVLEVRLLIVLLPGFGCGVWLAAGAGRAVVPGVPGCAPAPTAPGGPPLVQLGWFVLVKRVLAGRAAAASR